MFRGIGRDREKKGEGKDKGKGERRDLLIFFLNVFGCKTPLDIMKNVFYGEWERENGDYN